jgi:hypothetical protein
MANSSISEIDTKTKVYNLYNELCEAKKDKKDTIKAHNENIKRIEAELDDILKAEEDDIKNAQEVAE